MKKFTLIFLLLPFFIEAQIKNRSKEEAGHFIDSLRQEVVKGTSFAVLAALYSEDPGSATKAGQLSPFVRGQMVPEFEKVAFSLKIGEISEVFETQFGFHFIQVIGREDEKISARHILISYK